MNGNIGIVYTAEGCSSSSTSKCWRLRQCLQRGVLGVAFLPLLAGGNNIMLKSPCCANQWRLPLATFRFRHNNVILSGGTTTSSLFRNMFLSFVLRLLNFAILSFPSTIFVVCVQLLKKGLISPFINSRYLMLSIKLVLYIRQ